MSTRPIMITRTHHPSWLIGLVLGLAAAAASAQSGAIDSCKTPAKLPPDDTSAPLRADQGECVVLIHGLARSKRSMQRMHARLASLGYSVANVDYPSRHHAIETLAPDAVNRGLAECRSHDATTIHFVTHSLGGILVRHEFARTKPPELGRVVMLGPPNQGSEVVDALRNVPGFLAFNGPAGQQLGTDADSTPLALGPADFPVGIIAGTRSINPILSQWLPNPDDGKVSVARARLEGMSDFLAMPVAHPFLMSNRQIIEQVVHFLADGEFSRDCGDE